MEQETIKANQGLSPASIRLSTLSPHTRSYVSKYDSDNDGAISVDEALNNLIKVQKESNSFKKGLYGLIPTFFVLLACVFGVTIGAIHLTKDLYVKNDVLTTSSGAAVKVAQQTFSENIYSSLFRTIEYSSQIENILIGDMSYPVSGIHQNENAKTIFVLSFDGYLTLDANLTMKAFPFAHLQNDPLVKRKYDQLSHTLSLIPTISLAPSSGKHLIRAKGESVSFLAWAPGAVIDNLFIPDESVGMGGSEGGGFGAGNICGLAANCTNIGVGITPTPPPLPFGAEDE